jgi:hypothetical protein
MSTVLPLPVAPGSRRPTKASGYVDGRHGGGRSQREVRLLLPSHHQERAKVTNRIVSPRMPRNYHRGHVANVKRFTPPTPPSGI